MVLGGVFRVQGAYPNIETSAVLDGKYLKNREKIMKKRGIMVSIVG